MPYNYLTYAGSVLDQLSTVPVRHIDDTA
jgi:hypothetical protein